MVELIIFMLIFTVKIGPSSLIPREPGYRDELPGAFVYRELPYRELPYKLVVVFTKKFR